MATTTATITPSRFLANLFAGWETGYLVLWRSDNKRSTWLTSEQLEQADALADRARKTPGENLYFGVGLQGAKSDDPFVRGEEAGVAAIPGTWLDLDLAESSGLKKSRKKYPPRDVAMQLLESLPMRPSVLVNSGGGLHVYWLFRELLAVGNAQQRTEAKAITTGWARLATEHLKRLGDYELDSGADLSRVLRVPGTWNYRMGRPVEVDPAYADLAAWPRYDVADFEQFASSDLPLLAAAGVNGHAAVADLVVDLTANPPIEKLEALRANSPEFRRVWDHRKEFSSNSEQELSLASYCVQALWTDQEIANLIISHRRRWEPDKLAKMVENRKYLILTLAKARGDASRDAAVRALNGDPAVDHQVAGQREAEARRAEERVDAAPVGPKQNPASEAPPANVTPQTASGGDRGAILARLSNVFGVPVSRWLQLGVEKPIFTLVLQDGSHLEIGGTDDVLKDCKAFQRAIYTTMGQVMQPVSKRAWVGICTALAQIRELDEADEIKEAAVAERGVVMYLRAKGHYEKEAACIEDAPFVENGRLYLKLEPLLKWLNFHTPDKWQRPRLVKAMRRLGFDDSFVHYLQGETRKTSRYWHTAKESIVDVVQGGTEGAPI